MIESGKAWQNLGKIRFSVRKLASGFEEFVLQGLEESPFMLAERKMIAAHFKLKVVTCDVMKIRQ
jgi:hypothetical protein